MDARLQAIEVERSLTSTDVIETLRYLFEMRGTPRHIRSDNGPELITQALLQSSEKVDAARR